MNAAISLFFIIRPLNIGLCAISVLVASLLINQLSSPYLFNTFYVVIYIAMSSNILNDICDIDIDRVNRPTRSLPSNNLSIKTAMFIMIVFLILGIYNTTFIRPLGQYMALFFIIPMCILYTPILKSIPLIGNITIGLILGSVFLFTEASLLNRVDKMFIPFFLSFGLTFIRELCKDAEDLYGDRIYKIHTFPNQYGLKNTLLVIRVFSIIFCIFSVVPYYFKIYSVYYLILLIMFIELPLLYSIFIYLTNNSGPEKYANVSKILKIITICGILVFISTLI